MATGDVVTSSDGKLAIEIGPWAKDKLFYVKNICDIFNVGMKNKWPIRTYIDLFSGPGICVVEDTREEIPGSPLIALRCKLPFTHYFFNDLKSELVESLKSRTAFCKFANVEYFSKDCNVVIDELLQKLPTKSLDFCFIDPLNWEINFNAIQKLTQNRNMDLLITFHMGNMKRTATKPTKKLMDFFPDPSWQQEYEKSGERRGFSGRSLLDAFEKGLKGIGYKEIRDHVFETNVGNVLLYYLIFASKHPRGAYFWDEVTKRSKAGQWRMQI